MPTKDAAPPDLKRSLVIVGIALTILSLLGSLAMLGQKASPKAVHENSHAMTFPSDFPAEPARYIGIPEAVQIAHIEATHHRGALQYITPMSVRISPQPRSPTPTPKAAS